MAQIRRVQGPGWSGTGMARVLHSCCTGSVRVWHRCGTGVARCGMGGIGGMDTAKVCWVLSVDTQGRNHRTHRVWLPTAMLHNVMQYFSQRNPPSGSAATQPPNPVPPSWMGTEETIENNTSASTTKALPPWRRCDLDRVITQRSLCPAHRVRCFRGKRNPFLFLGHFLAVSARGGI